MLPSAGTLVAEELAIVICDDSTLCTPYTKIGLQMIQMNTTPITPAICSISFCLP
jgi:hypothetical protein